MDLQVTIFRSCNISFPYGRPRIRIGPVKFIEYIRSDIALSAGWSSAGVRGVTNCISVF